MWWVILLGVGVTVSEAAEPWVDALAQMPFRKGAAELNQTNCVALVIEAFRSNAVVKALIFMPGATDEFYMFRRAKARLTNPSPSLMDAVSALTNQTLIRATFKAPFLLLHTAEDPLEPDIVIQDPATADRLKASPFRAELRCDDRDWDYLQPVLRWRLKMDVRPWRFSADSWHFYRHSFAADGLSCWEALETAAFAGKSRFTVKRKQVVFEPDPRVLETPRFDVFPR